MYIYMHVCMHVYCLFPHPMTQITGGQKNVFLPVLLGAFSARNSTWHVLIERVP